MIDKKIHYCWFGGKPLPKDAKKCIKTWKKFCPNYEIVEWNETNFDVNEHPFMKAAYENKKFAFVTDYARLKIVNENGGIYLDTDVKLLKSLDELLNYKAFFGAEQLKKYVATGLGFGSEAHNPLLEDLIRSYDNYIFDIDNIRNLSCPKINTQVFINHGYKTDGTTQNLEEAIVFSPEYFDPIAPGSDKNLISDDTYSIHLYNGSWTSRKSRLKLKLRNMIGYKNVLRIKKFLNFFNKNKFK